MKSSESTQSGTLSQGSKENHKAKRGVIYMIWGNSEKAEKKMQCSIASMKQHHPELPVHIERFDTDGKINKTKMCDLTPFEETLYLDNDTVVLGRLDFGFEKARKFGFVCGINECPWARRYGDAQLSGDMIEYNSGVMFFTKKAKPIFDMWNKLFPTLDSSIIFYTKSRQVGRQPVSDQAGLALAIEKTGFLPFVLPYNWNFRPIWHKSFFGPIKVWHDYSDVPPPILKWNENQNSEKTVIQYTELTQNSPTRQSVNVSAGSFSKPGHMVKQESFDSHTEDFSNIYTMLQQSDSEIMLTTEELRAMYELTLAANLMPGDLAECGVYQGTSALMIAAAMNKKKCLHLFESFQGTPHSDLPEDADCYEGHRKTAREYVDTLFQRHKQRFQYNVIIHEGWFKDTLKEVSDRQFSLVFIDANLYQSTKECIEFFYPRIVEGGWLVFDDFYYEDHYGVNKAVNEYFQTKTGTSEYLQVHKLLIVKKTS